MRNNEGICVQAAHTCLLCGTDGMLLYQKVRDRLFYAPGTWDLMRCPKCHFVWVNPRPVLKDIGNLYVQYFTHDTTNTLPRFARIRKIVRNGVLAANKGYGNLVSSLFQKKVGRILSRIKPIRERV